MDFSDDSSRGRWLETLPDLLDHCAAQWRLRIGQPLQGGFLASVFACVDAEGNQLVLKLSPPAVSTALEAAALGLWAGRGSVSLRACDLPSGALLLDRLIPGTPLPPRGSGGQSNSWRLFCGICTGLRCRHSTHFQRYLRRSTPI